MSKKILKGPSKSTPDKGYALITLCLALESYNINVLANKQIIKIFYMSFDVLKLKMEAISVKFYKKCFNCIED